ncbi:MAG TPA: hypothetical protein VK525_08905 [Candidatus Saccharimonadales bacterium]|nr:hypothetical protein [Candidatus Saccharimonadales bacterium]
MTSAVVSMRCQAALILSLSLLLASLPASSHRAAEPSDSRPPAAVESTQPPPPAIVIGFLGGMVRHDDAVHTEVQIARDLRRKYSEGVYVATFENRRRDAARNAILATLDTDHDGKLSANEKRNARIVLYGHSWGASAVVALARDLRNDGVPVLLTVQVDSVAKAGQNDSEIPENVVQAINFYQPDGWLHGQPQIHASDPSRTKILGNFRSQYKDVPYTCVGYPWFGRIFSQDHIKIECDMTLWNKIENLIREQLPAVQQAKQ